MVIDVVGAGLAGSTAARLLAEQGHEVHVYEQRSHVGGNCHDEITEDGIPIHTYGPHIFHTNSKSVWDFCSRFTRFLPYQHRVLSYVDGRMVPFPINRDTICQLYGVDLSISEVEGFLKDEAKKSDLTGQPANFREAIVSQVGEYLYTKMFREYTRKQWQTDPDNLAVEVAGRIPVRSNRDDRYFTDKYQGIPDDGYTAMISRMLDHPDIHLYLNAYHLGSGNPENLTVYTGRIDEFFKKQFGELSYRSVQFEFETLKGTFQPVATVNYPNDYDFTRITEFKHFNGVQSANTVILKEYPSEKGVPAYVVLDKRNTGLRTRYLEAAAELEAANRVLFVGRLAEYKYYNMDQVIEAVQDKVDALNSRLAARNRRVQDRRGGRRAGSRIGKETASVAAAANSKVTEVALNA